MKFNYPNLTPGYAGIKAKKPTLNSGFYAQLFSVHPAINDPIIFPQRVVKKELFDEIIMLEDRAAKIILKNHQKLLSESMTGSLKVISKYNPAIQKTALNWMNLLLRNGLAENVYSLDENILKQGMDADNFLEAQFIKEIALFQTVHLNEKNATQKGLVRLVKKILKTKNVSNRIKILVLNFFIVAIYRFGMKLEDTNLLKESYNTLELLTKTRFTYDFGDRIRTSVAYRGLAMVSDMGKVKQNRFLQDAEVIARDTKANNILEKLVLKENLYTCLQSLAKWNICHNQPDSAYLNLAEMIMLDPFDSIAYAEMGFFLLQQNEFKEASSYFKKAIKLGPPAVGMHTYYYAKCLLELRKKEAIQYLYLATELDKEAITPWLDIIDYYLSKKETIKAKKIIKYVLKRQRYIEQLEKDEYETLKKILAH